MLIKCSKCDRLCEPTWPINGQFLDLTESDIVECAWCSSTNTGEIVGQKTLVAKQQVTSESKTKDVHTEHCCSIHGCKYGYDDSELSGFCTSDQICTVANGTKQQSYPCEACSWIANDYPDSARYYEMKNGKAVLVNKRKEKKELLDKVRQFLWNTEHTLEDNICPDDIIAWSHELRVEFDKVFDKLAER